jgi:probable HAF family extracellular repeat protein
VGEFNDGITPTTGFVKDGATFSTFDVPGGSNTRAFGINETGQIVGDFHDGIKTHGFLKDGATFTTIDVPGARETQAFGINTAGQIVGVFHDASGLPHSFLKDGATFTTIDVPGSMSRGAFGVNETGQIVGYSSDAMRQHGFVATPAGVDTSPPVITVTASPATLSPPNGRLVTVTVSGTITDEPFRFGVNSAAYQVMDEYGQIQPSGSVTLGMDGSYAFTVALQASRRGNDQDGRRYTIEISATDNAGNRGSGSATVTVPRN